MTLRNKPIKNKHVAARNFAIFLIFLIVLSALFFYLLSSFDSPQAVAEQIGKFGIFGPIVIILLFTLEILVAPIPGFILAIASGYAFGGFWGAIYVYVGNLLGTSIAFFLSRRFGRPLIEHFVSSKKLDRYDCLLQNHGKILLWLIYLIPLFPSDIVTFLIGLTKMKWKNFISLVAIAYLPYVFLLNFFGASLFEFGLDSRSAVYGVIIFFLFLTGIIIYEYVKKEESQCG